MKSIKWTNKLVIGIPEIDKQHHELIDTINKTEALVKKKGSDVDTKKIIDSLTSFARVHFSTEEEIFAKWNYPKATEHMLEHEKLIIRVLKFENDFEKKKQEVLPELLDFLIEWLENHLKKHDFKYRDYFREIGKIK